MCILSLQVANLSFYIYCTLGSRPFNSLLLFCQYLKDPYLKDVLKSLPKMLAPSVSLRSSPSLHFRGLEAVLSGTHLFKITLLSW